MSSFFDFSLSINTDGFKIDEGTDAGVFCPNPMIEHSYKLNVSCNVFQAEILAIKKVAEMVRERCTSITGPVTTHAGLKAIKSSVIKSRVTLDYNKAHLEKRGRWDPGHCNIVGNGMADELAGVVV